MAAKKPKSQAASPKGVVGLIKKIVSRKPAPPPAPKSRAAKPKAERPAQAAPAANKGTTAANKGAPAAKAPIVQPVANGKATPPALPVAPVKKKPPSITITRPEATRPPVVIPPPRALEAPIGAPSILVPKGGLAELSLTPILRWMYVGGATRYEVEWSPDAHFGRGHSITVVATQTMITLETPNELKPATNYKWRVRGGNDAGWGPWSSPESFRSPEK